MYFAPAKDVFCIIYHGDLITAYLTNRNELVRSISKWRYNFHCVQEYQTGHCVKLPNNRQTIPDSYSGKK